MSGFVAEHKGADVRVSPNFGPRRDGLTPDAIILHYTGMERADAAELWLCDPASEVSSHYLVHEDGRIVQMVREADRAWHAGKCSWRGRTDMNSCSIGIEIANPGHAFGYPDFPKRQIAAVTALCRAIISRRHIPGERVLAHSDVAPKRKKDPGEKFPWQLLYESGVGHWVRPAPISEGGPTLVPGAHNEAVSEVQAALAKYGYGIGVTGRYDHETRDVVAAFQRHLRPARVDGVVDVSTLATLRRLLETRPVLVA
jgi:N-acetylmuramoyl-L-alanine amidase